MFSWLERVDPESSGLARMKREFGQMLEEGRHIFDAAINAFLGGTSPDVVREDIFGTDKRINNLERAIRREIVVHGTVHGAAQLPFCLILMSIVKDAERIGDYSKNLFDVAVKVQKSKEDSYYEDLVKCKNAISEMLRDAHTIYAAQDVVQANEFLRNGDRLQDHCDEQVDKLVGVDPGTTQPAATALAYRYYKRVVAHLLNIISSVVMPIDRLDYLDEDHRTRQK